MPDFHLGALSHVPPKVKGLCSFLPISIKDVFYLSVRGNSRISSFLQICNLRQVFMLRYVGWQYSTTDLISILFETPVNVILYSGLFNRATSAWFKRKNSKYN